jgi:hypothetical protein
MRTEKLVLKTALASRRRGRIQEMACEDVQSLLGADKYQSIKAVDRHPFFVELLVAHEGISKGKILGAGQNAGVKKLWSRDRIEELAAKLKSRAVPIYLFHDSSNRPRRKVGEIISATARKIKDRVSALAYAYISDPTARELIRKKELDTCSLEAELVFERGGENSSMPRGIDWIVNAIEAVTGIALGSNQVSRPGFPGASILAQVEEFEDSQADAGGRGIPELEQELVQKEDELGKLKSELARFQSERESNERKKKVAELVEKDLSGRNLKKEEQKLVLEEVSERIELKQPDSAGLEKSVKDELDRELGRLAQLRRIYSKPDAPLRPASSRESELPSNPLIPKD